MTSKWAPGRGFVQSSDRGGTVGGVFGGIAGTAKEPQQKRQATKLPPPGSTKSSQTEANTGGGNQSRYTYTSEDQQATIGKPWAPYAELSGMSLGYDRLQYHNNNIGIREGGGKKRTRNVNRGAGSEGDEEQQKTGNGGQGQHYDPLAREFDLRPPERQLAIGTRAARTPLNAGAQPAGALNAGPRVHATYERTPRVWEGQPAPAKQPMGELGMGQQPKTHREAGAGLGNRGRMQARTNIAHPDQGQTPASMSGGNVIDATSRDATPGPQRRENLRRAQYAPGVSPVESKRIGNQIESGNY